MDVEYPLKLSAFSYQSTFPGKDTSLSILELSRNDNVISCAEFTKNYFFLGTTTGRVISIDNEGYFVKKIFIGPSPIVSISADLSGVIFATHDMLGNFVIHNLEKSEEMYKTKFENTVESQSLIYLSSLKGDNEQLSTSGKLADLLNCVAIHPLYDKREERPVLLGFSNKLVLMLKSRFTGRRSISNNINEKLAVDDEYIISASWCPSGNYFTYCTAAGLVKLYRYGETDKQLFIVSKSRLFDGNIFSGTIFSSDMSLHTRKKFNSMLQYSIPVVDPTLYRCCFHWTCNSNNITLLVSWGECMFTIAISTNTLSLPSPVGESPTILSHFSALRGSNSSQMQNARSSEQNENYTALQIKLKTLLSIDEIGTPQKCERVLAAVPFIGSQDLLLLLVCIVMEEGVIMELQLRIVSAQNLEPFYVAIVNSKEFVHPSQYLLSAIPSDTQDEFYILATPWELLKIEPADNDDYVEHLVASKKYIEAFDSAARWGLRRLSLRSVGKELLSYLINKCSFFSPTAKSPNYDNNNYIPCLYHENVIRYAPNNNTLLCLMMAAQYVPVVFHLFSNPSNDLDAAHLNTVENINSMSLDKNALNEYSLPVIEMSERKAFTSVSAITQMWEETVLLFDKAGAAFLLAECIPISSSLNSDLYNKVLLSTLHNKLESFLQYLTDFDSFYNISIIGSEIGNAYIRMTNSEKEDDVRLTIVRKALIILYEKRKDYKACFRLLLQDSAEKANDILDFLIKHKLFSLVLDQLPELLHKDLKTVISFLISYAQGDPSSLNTVDVCTVPVDDLSLAMAPPDIFQVLGRDNSTPQQPEDDTWPLLPRNIIARLINERELLCEYYDVVSSEPTLSAALTAAAKVHAQQLALRFLESDALSPSASRRLLPFLRRFHHFITEPNLLVELCTAAHFTESQVLLLTRTGRIDEGLTVLVVDEKNARKALDVVISPSNNGQINQKVLFRRLVDTVIATRYKGLEHLKGTSIWYRPHTTVKGDTWENVADRYGVEADILRVFNKMLSESKKKTLWESLRSLKFIKNQINDSLNAGQLICVPIDSVSSLLSAMGESVRYEELEGVDTSYFVRQLAAAGQFTEDLASGTRTLLNNRDKLVCMLSHTKSQRIIDIVESIYIWKKYAESTPITLKLNDTRNRVCAACREPLYVQEEDPVVVFPCGHAYHWFCAEEQRWKYKPENQLGLKKIHILGPKHCKKCVKLPDDFVERLKAVEREKKKFPE